MPSTGPSQQYVWFHILYKIGSILTMVALLSLGSIWISVKLVSFKGVSSTYSFIHSKQAWKIDDYVIFISLLSNSLMWVLRPIVQSVMSMKTKLLFPLIVLIVLKLSVCFLIIGMLAFYCAIVRELELDVQLNAIYIFIGLLILLIIMITAGMSFFFSLKYLRKILSGSKTILSEPRKRSSNRSKLWQHIRSHPYPIVISLNIVSIFSFVIVFSPIFADFLPFYHMISTLLRHNVNTGMIVSSGGYMPYAPPNSPLGLKIASTTLDALFTLDCSLTGDLALAATNCYDMSKCVSEASLKNTIDAEGHGRDYGFSGIDSQYDILTLSSSQITSLDTGSKYLEIDPFGHISPFLINIPDRAYASEIINIEDSYIENLKAQNVSLFVDTLLLGLSITPYTLVRLLDRPNVIYFSNHSGHNPYQNNETTPIPYARVLGTSFVYLIRTLSVMAASQLDSCGVLIDNPITFQEIASNIDLTYPYMKLLIPANVIVNKSLINTWLHNPVEKAAVAGVYCTFHSASYCVKATLTALNNSSFETHFLYANSFLMMTAAILIKATYIHTEFFAAYGPDSSFVINSVLFFNLRVGFILYVCVYCLLIVSSLAILCYSEILLKR